MADEHCGIHNVDLKLIDLQIRIVTSEPPLLGAQNTTNNKLSGVRYLFVSSVISHSTKLEERRRTAGFLF